MLKLSFRQQVLSGFAVSLVLVIIVGLLSYKSINELESDSITLDHTQKVVKISTNLVELTVDAETSMRGFCATNNTVFLDPYKAALPVIRANLERLRSLVLDNSVQQKRVDSLAYFVNAQLDILKENIEARQTKGLSFMVRNHMFLNGKLNMDQIRKLDNKIIEAENFVYAYRRANSQAVSTKALILIVCGSVVFLVIITALFYYIVGTVRHQWKIEGEITNANRELEATLTENKIKNWLLTGTSLLNAKILGLQDEKEVSESILNEICSYCKAASGTLYLYDDDIKSLTLGTPFAIDDPIALKKTIKIGEGWVGQAAKDRKPAVIRGTLNEGLKISSSLIRQNLIESIIVPFFYDKKLKGVIELAFEKEIEKQVTDYILIVADIAGVAVNTAQINTTMKELLSQVQLQTEELEAQQEEMRVTNEELLTKTQMLIASEEELRVQQEELRTTNSELEEKASLLEEKNQAIEEARTAINLKVRELEITGKYKSEFLANMSHELRTPLNSILVLARILKDNKPENLTEEQIKYASVIFNAGNDLLTLINDILDLSKIESGKLEIHNEPVKIEEVVHDMEMLFAEVAVNKKISYTTYVDENLPFSIFTDKIRAEQVLKNLLSNAFKFTPEYGSVAINVTPGDEYQTVNFSVKDSGIGIPADKQKIIFEAFQQADGSTSRKYGGTGLGLSISRELVSLLGGKITLNSEPGLGSEFVLTLPYKADLVLPETETFSFAEISIAGPEHLKPVMHTALKNSSEPLVIIVEDDKNFADVLYNYSLEHGYRPLLVSEGTNAVEIITSNQPDAVILDIMLPGKDGWQILKELKQSEKTLHIPVHLMSASDAAANKVEKEGAISFIKKPVETTALDKLFSDISSRFKQILLIEDNRAQSNAINDQMRNQGITVDQAFDGETALKLLHENEYQCVILDLNLPDISGLDFLDKIKAVDKFKDIPVIINTAMELDKTSVNRLMKYANAMVVKTNKSADRLIDEVNLFLHKVSETTERQTSTSQILKSKFIFPGKDVVKGKKVLIADDDMRNIFALSSALQGYDMLVEIAGDGSEALDKLNSLPNIDIVLMDIMMPKMDGYEAMRQIRSQNKWARLPIIALTAKAMMDDREKCIAAGANDYITKPVDVDRLISLIQLWLGR